MKIIKQTSSDVVFPYIAYVPNRVSKRPALLLQLHGAGERGSSEEDLDKVLIHGFSRIVNDENLKDCILVMPQCPKDSFWVAKIESLKRFLDQIVDIYNVDAERIYLCGLSMGGYGTWYTAMAYPDIFAAIAPCCGGGMPWNAGVLKMPVFAFHGKLDNCVSVTETISMVESMRKTGLDPECTLYDDVYHDSWVRAFSEELLSKLLSNRKR